jgi:hypothetical protein
MQQQWTHGQDVATLGDTVVSDMPSPPRIDLSSREATRPMRAGENTDRAVFRATGIEMEAQRQHLLQDGHRRLYVDDARLLRPTSTPRRSIASVSRSRSWAGTTDRTRA